MPLHVNVVHGDLRFMRRPLLLGHASSSALTGSEATANSLLGNALQESLDLGLYPDAPGTHQIFINHYRDRQRPELSPAPTAVIVLGLGHESQLQSGQLQDAICQAVLAWQRDQAAAQQGQKLADLTLAATCLGSGREFTVSQSAHAVVQGVLQANARGEGTPNGRKWPRIGQLELVELYHDRALEAWHAVHDLESLESNDVSLTAQVQTMAGGRQSVPGGRYRSSPEESIRIRQESKDGAGNVVLEFAWQSHQARTEVFLKRVQQPVLQRMLLLAEADTDTLPETRQVLTQLLLPVELIARLARVHALVLEVDANTAWYPWELLTPGESAQKSQPWAIHLPGGVLRKLHTDKGRHNPVIASSKDVLVVGDPIYPDESKNNQLLRAVAEAEVVVKLFGAVATSSIQEDSLDITRKLLARPWKVLHLCGHGRFDPQTGRVGMPLSDKHFLGLAELDSMAQLPELVFVNCCRQGTFAASGEVAFANPQFASNMAEQLIRNGVRCVVAAAWGIHDDAALAFAKAFYTALLSQQQTFAEAVRAGRQAAYEAQPGQSDWAAWQCYGDGAWRLQPSNLSVALQTHNLPPLPTETELLGGLQILAQEAQHAAPGQRAGIVANLETLLKDAPPAWQAQGRVAQAVAMVWRELGNQPNALAWFDKAVRANDGSATFFAREQQLNLQSRTSQSIVELEPVIADLQALLAVAATAERWSLLGSAYKSMVVLCDAAATDPGTALQQMEQAYAAAVALNPAELYYPLGQQWLAQLRLYWLGNEQQAPEQAVLDAISASLQQQNRERPDFWNEFGQYEVTMLQALLARNLAENIEGILDGLRLLQVRVANPHLWDSGWRTAEFVLPHYQKSAELTPAEQQAANVYRSTLLTYKTAS